MIDTNNVIREWLLRSPTVVDLVGSRIYSPSIPQYYNPVGDGLAIAISNRGGTSWEEAPIVDVSVQIETWAPQGEGIRARQLMGVVYDVMNNANNIDLGDKGYIFASVEEVAGQDTIDPETKWASVISFYHLMMRAN